MLIGLVGLIGSGKDTVAERLVSHHGYKRDSFAKSLNTLLKNSLTFFGVSKSSNESFPSYGEKRVHV